MVELADAAGLKSAPFGGASASLARATILRNVRYELYFL